MPTASQYVDCARHELRVPDTRLDEGGRAVPFVGILAVLQLAGPSRLDVGRRQTLYYSSKGRGFHWELHSSTHRYQSALPYLHTVGFIVASSSHHARLPHLPGCLPPALFRFPYLRVVRTSVYRSFIDARLLV